MVYEDVARRGHLEILDFLSEKGYHWTPQACVAAVEEDQMKVLEWAMKRGYPAFDSGIERARLLGNFRITRWFEEKYSTHREIRMRFYARDPSASGRQTFKAYLLPEHQIHPMYSKRTATIDLQLDVKRSRTNE
jgi:hypothetical protein